MPEDVHLVKVVWLTVPCLSSSIGLALGEDQMVAFCLFFCFSYRFFCPCLLGHSSTQFLGSRCAKSQSICVFRFGQIVNLSIPTQNEEDAREDTVRRLVPLYGLYWNSLLREWPYSLYVPAEQCCCTICSLCFPLGLHRAQTFLRLAFFMKSLFCVCLLACFWVIYINGPELLYPTKLPVLFVVFAPSGVKNLWGISRFYLTT